MREGEASDEFREKEDHRRITGPTAFLFPGSYLLTN